MFKKSKKLLKIAFLLFILMCVILSINLTKGLIEKFQENEEETKDVTVKPTEEATVKPTEEAKEEKKDIIEIPIKILLRPATYLCPNNCQTMQFTDANMEARYGFYIKDTKITTPTSNKVDFKDINDPMVFEQFRTYFLKSFIEGLPESLDADIISKMKIVLVSITEEPIYYHNFTDEHINNWSKGTKNQVMEKVETRGLMVNFKIEMPFEHTDIPVDSEEVDFKKVAFNKDLNKQMIYFKILKMLKDMSVDASMGKFYISIPEKYSVEDDRKFLPSTDYVGEKNGFTYATSFGIDSLKNKSGNLLKITNLGNGYYRNYSHAWDILYMSVTSNEGDENYLWKYPSLKLANELDNTSKLPNTLEPNGTEEPNGEEDDTVIDETKEPGLPSGKISRLFSDFLNNI